MIHFLKLQEKINRQKPWLILGKGPSFSHCKSYNLAEYNLLGLNHVPLILPVDVCHLIDMDVLCEKIVRNSRKIVMPFHPHYENKATSRTLNEHENTLLTTIKLNQKLYWYNLSTWKGKHREPIKPLVCAKYFSAEAAFHILGLLGIKRIFSLGVDGGKEYASEFSTKGLKPFTNRRGSFDVQFKEIEKICLKFSITWTKL
jgi:hypothetical protein